MHSAVCRCAMRIPERSRILRQECLAFPHTNQIKCAFYPHDRVLLRLETRQFMEGPSNRARMRSL